MGGVHITAVDLAEVGLAAVFVAARTSRQPAGQFPVELADEHEGVVGLRGDYGTLPTQRAKREVVVQAAQVILGDHLRVSSLPGAYVR
jgi:hypothetical protein